MDITLDLIKEFVEKEIFTMSELSLYTNSLNILLTGSRAVGGFSDKSDVDLDIICTEEVYKKIKFIDIALLSNGCEPEWVSAGYNNIDDYFLS